MTKINYIQDLMFYLGNDYKMEIQREGLQNKITVTHKETGVFREAVFPDHHLDGEYILDVVRWCTNNISKATKEKK